MFRCRAVAASALFLAFTSPALWAQVTVKPDGVWRSLVSIGGSASSGNTKSASITANAEAVRVTDQDKWGLQGRGIYTKTPQSTTAANLALGAQYDRDFNPRWFGFGKLDHLHDKPANLSARNSLYSGVGRHMVRNDNHTWDILGGLGFVEDRYVAPTEIDGERRDRFGRIEAVISQASTHKLTASTSFRQKIEIYPSLKDHGEYRALLDTGITVAMTENIGLTAGLIYRYNSDPGTNTRSGDGLFVTGITMRFD